MSSAFQLQYEPLSPSHASWGGAAIIPWDSEIFGFSVAQLELGDASIVALEEDAFRTAAEDWAAERNVRMMSCRVKEAGNRKSQSNAWPPLLSRAGWNFIEYSMLVQVVRLRKIAFPHLTIPVRSVHADDCDAILKIAESAFDAGRYHADSQFPVALANRRYARWMKNTLAETLGEDKGGNRVYVIEAAGQVCGFIHAVIENRVADMRLAAIDVATIGGLAGFNLYIGALKALRDDEDVLHVQTRVAASNTAVLNIYSSLGCRFAAPEAVFHWWNNIATGLEDKENR